MFFRVTGVQTLEGWPKVSCSLFQIKISAFMISKMPDTIKWPQTRTDIRLPPLGSIHRSSVLHPEVIDIVLPRGAIRPPCSAGNRALRNAVAGIGSRRSGNFPPGVLRQFHVHGKTVTLPQRPCAAKIVGRRAIISLGETTYRTRNCNE